MSRKAEEHPPEADEGLASLLERAARSLGWLLPETPAEARTAEEEQSRPLSTAAHAVAEPITHFATEESAKDVSAGGRTQKAIALARVGMSKRHPWTNRSVLEMAEGEDPVAAITRLSQKLIRTAMDAGWSGPPFDPIHLAQLLKIPVVPRDEVRDARIVPVGADGFRIEFNPSQPRFRVRYSLAHELAHTLFPDCGKAIRNRARPGDRRGDEWQLEALCNIGAAEILMPAGTEADLHESVAAVDLVGLQKKYEVSTETLLIRIAKTSAAACAAFCASKAEHQISGRHYVLDYIVGSPTWTTPIGHGDQVPADSAVSECTAIGFTSKGDELWRRHPVHVECVALPSYPGALVPRVAGLLLARGAEAEPNPFDVREVRGDATQPRGEGHRIIAHVVNDATPNWGGAGFAAAIAARFPSVQDEFRSWVQEDRARLRLGNTHISEVDASLSVFHMVAQKGYGPSPKPRIRYLALQECLERLSEVAQSRNASVHMPLIGTGQAGGSWKVVRDMLLELVCAQRLSVTAYVPPNRERPRERRAQLDLPGEQPD